MTSYSLFIPPQVKKLKETFRYEEFTHPGEKICLSCNHSELGGVYVTRVSVTADIFLLGSAPFNKDGWRTGSFLETFAPPDLLLYVICHLMYSSSLQFLPSHTPAVQWSTPPDPTHTHTPLPPKFISSHRLFPGLLLYSCSRRNYPGSF